VAINNKTNSTASSGYKKRFEKLINYHINHASSELESITKKDIKDDSFHLSEHYNTGKSEFDREIKVSYSIKNNTFIFSIRIDNILVENKTVDSYEKLVERLGSYMFLPDEGTSEYEDLLVEWVVMNNATTSSSQPAPASAKTNKEKFTELVSYMQQHKSASVIFTSVNGPNDTGFEYEEQRASADESEYNLSVEVSLSKQDLFTIQVNKNSKRVYTIVAKGWEDLLRYLRIYFHAPNMGSPEYISLTESFSIADDFKLYENLWD
jgi:hypothetical protein